MLANLFITLLKLITLPWAGGSKFAPRRDVFESEQPARTCKVKVAMKSQSVPTVLMELLNAGGLTLGPSIGSSAASHIPGSSTSQQSHWYRV